jgi:ATP-dependent DNA helicase RecG
MFVKYDEIANTPIEYLKGVGPAKGNFLRSELGISNFGDLLFHFPFRYVDRSRFYLISEVPQAPGEVQIKGRITALQEVTGKRRKRLVGRFSDGKQSIEVVWFKSISAIQRMVKVNQEYILFGKPQVYQSVWSFVHPEMEPLESVVQNEFGSLHPVYPSTEKLTAKGLNGRAIARLVRALFRARADRIRRYRRLCQSSGEADAYAKLQLDAPAWRDCLGADRRGALVTLSARARRRPVENVWLP